MIAFLLVTLITSQVCLGEIDPIGQKQFLKSHLEVKTDEAYKELVEPILTELNRLNHTIQTIKQRLANRKSLNEYSYEENLILNFNKVSTEDKCQNLSDYLPVAQETVEKVFYMSMDISGALAGVFVDGLNCLNINIFRAIACFISDLHELKVIYSQYKPEIDPMMEQVKAMLSTLYVLFEQCMNEI
ncbi:hypothetical protein O3M35_006097 [Rhynocoris fuscipes]|uniref:Secreted protein n=1 Tax=Rhynocoris fuscipes TaxID=488301 RepID=A0AAW1DC34_9HEMI